MLFDTRQATQVAGSQVAGVQSPDAILLGTPALSGPRLVGNPLELILGARHRETAMGTLDPRCNAALETGLSASIARGGRLRCHWSAIRRLSVDDDVNTAVDPHAFQGLLNRTFFCDTFPLRDGRHGTYRTRDL